MLSTRNSGNSEVVTAPWQIPRRAFLASAQAKLDEADEAYARLYRLYVPDEAYPVGADFWTRYGHEIEIGGGLTSLYQDPEYRRAQRARSKAQVALSRLSRSHRQAVERAVRAQQPVPPDIVADYPDLVQRNGLTARTR
ncbi:MAG: hypothetical protein HY316_09915 [Acidobacteria bacterium]|nr:hypothetical protein [Acidobacteriota bacterium]